MKSAGLLALAVFGSVAAATPVDSLKGYQNPESILVREDIKTGKSEVLNNEAQIEKAFWDGEGQYPQMPQQGGYPGGPGGGGGYPGGEELDGPMMGGDPMMNGGPMGGPNGRGGMGGPQGGPGGPGGGMGGVPPMGAPGGPRGGMAGGPVMGGPGPGYYGYNNYGPGGYPPGAGCAGEVYYNNSPYCGGPVIEENGNEEYRVRRYYRRFY